MFSLPRQAVTVMVPSKTPSLEGDRLRLRPVTDADIPAIFAIRSRPEVAKFNHPKAPFQTITEAREWLTSKTFATGPSEIVGRSFALAIVDKSIAAAQETMVGYVSINTLDPCPQIGYSVLPEHWGKGYATEAVQMMLRLWWQLPRREFPSMFSRDEDDEVEKVYAICEKENHGSCRVLTKCGFEQIDEIRYEADELYFWAACRPCTD
ncbi:hypothetical protein N7532_007111 [Penicillium argentinense]|uniref:N-acetyltransferase domain-containing protein n=1 Tax=Penicillium argentinense TaxID=1131581 RepID=A0A9W9KBF4_9EURO|nr:uncharacterized protein N7532_007111 [Penicillium argentinense]KAJ5100110.1 hypothetical protein N7532_007111 [Penicillium argentinense]